MRYEDKKALSLARMNNAESCLSSAKTLKDADDYKGAANRSYYAIFHAMRAVLAFDEIDMKHHSGIISEFRRLYIKTDVFKPELSRIISELFDVRTESDYDDFFVISKPEVNSQIKSAEYFIENINAYLQTK